MPRSGRVRDATPTLWIVADHEQVRYSVIRGFRPYYLLRELVDRGESSGSPHHALDPARAFTLMASASGTTAKVSRA